MRDFRRWTLALAALLLWGTPARPADNERPVPEEGAVQVMLLRQKSVRDELKLTDDEAKKVHDFTRRQYRKALEIEKESPANRDAKYAELTRENEQFLKDVLEPQERKRLDQITLQVAGLLWVTNPDVASRIDLSDQQRSRAKLLQQEARREAEELIHTHRGEQRKAKLRELRSTSRKRLNDLLTDEQETKWKEMTGEPFEGDLHFQDAENDQQK